MSGLIGIFGAPPSDEEEGLRRMLQRSRRRGPDRAGCWTGQNAALGVCRADWEMGPDFADGVLVWQSHTLVVAADATLYYRAELGRRLAAAGVLPEGRSPTHLIVAAYRAWGPGMLDLLEGDYAFALWDSRERLLLAARDFAGNRPLHFAHLGERLILASSLTAVAAHPAVPRDLNPLVLLEDMVAASSVAVQETAFRAIEQLPAGARLLWRPGAAPVVERFWDPPCVKGDGGRSPSDAAEELVTVLGDAVKERLARESPTAVWTSGGFDSPAVLALAKTAVVPSGSFPVVPVSMSYPVGDPGREDELVEAVGHHLGVPIDWLQVTDVPGLPDPLKWAARRDHPFAHPYEEWNRALARGSRAAGARVVMGGNGGDQFFSVSPVFLADLARRGRLVELVREARAIGFGRNNPRELFHWAIQPALPATLLNLAAQLRKGRPLRPHLATAVPDWMGLNRLTTDALWHRQWHYNLRRPQESLASAETAWYLTTSFGQRVCAEVAEIVLDCGAEVRSPMYDRRVIEFMAGRPREDRFHRGENKCLLRRAMRGLLPESHLAPRQQRTGLPSAYLKRIRREALPRWAEAIQTECRLADLGLADPARIRGAVNRYLENPKWEGTLGSELFNLFSAEFWIRAHAELAVSPIEWVA